MQCRPSPLPNSNITEEVPNHGHRLEPAIIPTFCVPLYTEEGAPYTYEVEIQESTDVPGLYRIVNAYAPVANAFGEAGGNENITIHAEDATGVYFINQPVGLDFGDGEI